MSATEKVSYRAAGDQLMVSLTEEEAAYAWGLGLQKRKTAANRGVREYIPDPKQGDRSQCLGDLAEEAIGKALGIPAPHHDGVFNDVPDLPPNIEAKAIGKEHWGMRVYSNTPDSRWVVGVIIPRGNDPRGNHPGPYRLPGWCYAHEGKRDEWNWLSKENGGRPVFLVPQDHLRPISELMTLLDADDIHSGVDWW